MRRTLPKTPATFFNNVRVPYDVLAVASQMPPELRNRRSRPHRGLAIHKPKIGPELKKKSAANRPELACLIV